MEGEPVDALGSVNTAKDRPGTVQERLGAAIPPKAVQEDVL